MTNRNFLIKGYMEKRSQGNEYSNEVLREIAKLRKLKDAGFLHKGWDMVKGWTPFSNPYEFNTSNIDKYKGYIARKYNITQDKIEDLTSNPRVINYLRDPKENPLNTGIGEFLNKPVFGKGAFTGSEAFTPLNIGGALTGLYILKKIME